MQPYRPLPEQIAEQLARGRTMIVELDSWYLPDTAATSYRREHVKSSVVAEAIDPAGERLRYFHATGLHELQRRGLPRRLPPRPRVLRGRAAAVHRARALRRRAAPLTGDELRDGRARAAAPATSTGGPATNPFVRFGEQLERDLPRLLEGDAADYHAYAFATVRMAGAAFEVAGSHVDWLLGERGRRGVRGAAQRIVEGCKVLSFRLARRRAFEPAAGDRGARGGVGRGAGAAR